MKKIGLITIHATTNYGGVLQALASQKVLERFGDVRIIDYRNSFVDKTMQLIRFGMKPRDVLRVMKDLFRLYPRFRVINKFENFIEQHMKLTERANHRLDKVVTEFDVFVTGSDQIWNPKTVSENQQLDSVYLLDFVKSKRKISYASSIGSYQVQKDDVLTQSLSSFDAISVREKCSAKELENVLNRAVEHVLDPTLLLTKSEWMKLLDLNEFDQSDRKYIFLYALKKDQLFKESVKKIAKLTGLDVVIVDQDPFVDITVSKQYKDASPAEFLNLFLNAELIITNSFHGAAFSANFEKQFYSVLPPASSNRVIDLLSELGLSDRLITNKGKLDSLEVNKCSFTETSKKLESLRQTSMQYLKTGIDG